MRQPFHPNCHTMAKVTDSNAAGVRAVIKQTQPFASIRQEAHIAMLATTDALRRPMTELFARAGDLTHQQYNVLRILRGALPDGLPTLEIADRMVERTPGITRLIDRLEAKGLVTRTRSETDRRQVFCRLTPAGSRLLAGLDQPVEAHAEQLMAGLDDRQVRQLIRLLDKLRQGLPD